MGDPKFSLGGLTFPLDRFSKLDFSVMPVRSGGYLLQKEIRSGRIDWLHNVKGKAGVVTRIHVPSIVAGQEKQIQIHEDWVTIGDRMYKRASDIPKK